MQPWRAAHAAPASTENTLRAARRMKALRSSTRRSAGANREGEREEEEEEEEEKLM